MRVASHLNTVKTPKLDTIFGRQVEDDYRWLETPTAAREAWIQDQVSRTDQAIDRSPNHGQIRNRLHQLVNAVIAAERGEMLEGEGYQLQWSREPGARYKLSRFEGEQVTVIFDPNNWPTGQTLSWHSLSPDNRYLAYAKVLNGQDHGALEIMDTATCEVLHTLPGADTLNPSTWTEDNQLVTSLPGFRPGLWSFDAERGRLQPRAPQSRGVYGEVAAHQGRLLYTVDSERAYLQEEAILLEPGGRPVNTGLPVGKMSFSAHQNNVFIQTTAQAPDGRVLLMDLADEHPHPRQIVPAVAGRRLTGFQALKDKVAVTFSENSMPGLAIYDLEGKLVHQITREEPGVFSDLKTDAQGNLLYQWSSLSEPRTTSKLDPETLESEVVRQDQLPGYDPALYKTERRWFTSADGTRVPMTLAYRKDLKLDGSNPTHLQVYGGFATASETEFKSTRVPFLEAGGICAIVHARGGNEMGEQWHRQATGLNRVKVHQDVEGAARFLAAEGYTSAQHLGLEGTSNGALVTGVAVTQHPELFDAAVAHVGLFDMARYERLGGGGYSREYGSIRRPDEAEGLLSWSPYHNVREGVSYPAMLVSTGKHDNRVNPAHSYKFAAHLQEHETSDKPVLLRVEEHLGHGHGLTLDQFLDRQADSWTFLLDELTD